MATDTNTQSEVLHSENHSKLSAEEIQKALDRHNKHHPAEKAKSAAPKSKKANKT